MLLSNARAVASALLLLALAGCGEDEPAVPDASTPDAAPRDAAPPDGGAPPTDAGSPDDAQASSDGGTLDAGPPGCIDAEREGTGGTSELTTDVGTASVAIDDRAACLRTYRITSTAPRRDSLPESPRVITEREGDPSIRTGSDLFDALHALAIEEAHENAVGAVRDYAFDDGRPVPCGDEGCFETGRLWNYVWTRDTAYAVDLGLAAIDPLRARNSLLFKLSERRGGGGLEIVQDTGSGGSWPVSTDRVAWALGAEELLGWLGGPERDAFAATTLAALRNTIERDRRMIFDPRDGLYRGEQSFLDWREQTYPEWTAGALAHIAMSKSLSTNLLHLRAIELAARLASDAGDDASAARWSGWASELRAAIHGRLWLEDEGMFSTYVTTDLDPSPVRRFDLLGESLAILSGVATPREASRILSTYPHFGAGPAPVVHPQQQHVRIYHNRAEWPFVTAYWLRAARHADHAAAGERAIRSLVRGAAMNLSNMENFEIATGLPWLDDGDASGPVVNSQRQLWSVAGYLAMVHHVIFGLEADAEGLRVRPWITRAVHESMFPGARSIVLRGIAWRGRVLDVIVRLPEGTPLEGSYAIESVRLDGVVVGDRALGEDELGARSQIEVVLRSGEGAEDVVTAIDPAAWRAVFGPRTPAITSLTEEGGRVRLALDLGGESASDVTWAVYRDGDRVAGDLPGGTSTYLDEATDAATTTHCWAVETCFVSTGTCSQHSPPSCHWGASSARAAAIPASSFTATGGAAVTEYGRFHYQAWGDPGHRLETPAWVAPASGAYLLQAEYGNGGPTDTGITCAIKRVVVEDVASGSVVADGVLVMPHMGSWDRWGESSFARVELESGRSYRFVLLGDDDTVNMSAFQHFAAYTANAGGRSGQFSRVNVAELRVLRVEL